MFSTRWSSRRGAVISASSRITSGTRMLSSYGTILLDHRCSPHIIPLSDVNTITAFDNRPVSVSASRISETARSTDRSARYWSRRNRSIDARVEAGSGPRPRMYAGLSLTSASS